MPNQNEPVAEAYNLLLEEVAVPAFFNKLAEFNVVPQSDEAAEALLQLADVLSASTPATAEKQAQLIRQACHDIAKAAGVPDPTSQQEEKLAAERASNLAAHFAQNPAINQAATILASAIQAGQ